MFCSQGSVKVFFTIFVNIRVISVPPSTSLSTITRQVSVDVQVIVFKAATDPSGPFSAIVHIILNVDIDISKYVVSVTRNYNGSFRLHRVT